MKKALKSVLCSLLAVVMVFSCTSVAFAKNNVTPVIIVHGKGGSPLYLNPDTDEQQEVKSFDFSSLFSVYNGLLKKVLASAQGKPIDADELIDEFAALMNEYSDTACDKNGNSVLNVSINNYFEDSLANHTDYLTSSDSAEPSISRQICDKIGAENVYAFNYDWRLDACYNAKLLNKFIDSVKAQTGKSKVTLVSCSEGTVVVSAYIDEFMSKNDIERTVFVNGALYGVGVTNLFSQDVVIDKDVLLNYIYDITHTYNNRSMDMTKLAFLSYTMDSAIGNLCDLLNEIKASPRLMKKIYNNVLMPNFGNLPIMWEFVPYDCFNNAVKKMTDIGFLDQSSGLYKKIKKYHGVQGRLKSNLKKLEAKGVDIAIVSNYGTPDIPITSFYDEQCDVLIETSFSSVGATVAKYGETLSKDGKYVSADKIIDASTCTLPDNTWFIKGIQHMDFWYNTEATQFVATLATADVKLSVNNIEKETGIGQFVGTDKGQNIIDVTESGSALERIISSTSAEQEEIKSPPTSGDSTIIISLVTAALSALCFVIVYRKKALA